MIFDTNVRVCVAVYVFWGFLVAFRKGQREEKHGIYDVKHTLFTSTKSYVLHGFLTSFGTHLGALGHICVSKCHLGSILEKVT